jgi:hypothetical protein
MFGHTPGTGRGEWQQRNESPINHPLLANYAGNGLPLVSGSSGAMQKPRI